MIDLEKHAEAILSRALANGGALAEIYLEESTAASIRFDDGKTERVNASTTAGAGIRVLDGERTLYAHTNDLTLEGLLRCANLVAAGASGDAAAPDFGFSPARHEMPVRTPARDIPMAQKLALVTAADAAARAHDPRVRQVSVSYADGMKRVVIVNSAGTFVEDTRPSILFLVQVVAAADGIIQTGYEPVGARMGFEIFDQKSPESVAIEAARQACLMLDAHPAPSGTMPVVLSSEAGGTMIHEAVGHGLEADHIDKGMSKYCGHLDEEIAVPMVSVVDDGSLPRMRGTLSVDDEGTPVQPTVLIDKGVLVGFMHDLKSANKLGHTPTGNGRRQSYAHKPMPRMTNTLLMPGDADPAQILAETDTGLFVKKMGGGQVNPLNGDYVFDVTEGYLIRNGRAETPVRGATLIGNGPDTLRDIEAVGNDLGFGIGTCGKDGQGVPVSDAQPTIRVRRLTVGGTATA